MFVQAQKAIDNGDWVTPSNSFPNCKYKIVEGIAYVIISCTPAQAPASTWTPIGTYPKYKGLSADAYVSAIDNDMYPASIQVKTSGKINVYGGRNGGGGCFTFVSYPTV